jgi:hypothetical protein
MFFAITTIASIHLCSFLALSVASWPLIWMLFGAMGWVLDLVFNETRILRPSELSETIHAKRTTQIRLPHGAAHAH